MATPRADRLTKPDARPLAGRDGFHHGANLTDGCHQQGRSRTDLPSLHQARSTAQRIEPTGQSWQRACGTPHPNFEASELDRSLIQADGGAVARPSRSPEEAHGTEADKESDRNRHDHSPPKPVLIPNSPTCESRQNDRYSDGCKHFAPPRIVELDHSHRMFVRRLSCISSNLSDHRCSPTVMATRTGEAAYCVKPLRSGGPWGSSHGKMVACADDLGRTVEAPVGDRDGRGGHLSEIRGARSPNGCPHHDRTVDSLRGLFGLFGHAP